MTLANFDDSDSLRNNFKTVLKTHTSKSEKIQKLVQVGKVTYAE